jgi:ankyrin repeat protein
VELIIDSGLDVNTTYDEGKTLFIKACERNNMPLVQLLCDKEANVTIRDDRGYKDNSIKIAFL